MVEVEMKVEDISHFIFLLITSYFSLSFYFSPLSFLLLFFLSFQKTSMRIWRSFRISEESM